MIVTYGNLTIGWSRAWSGGDVVVLISSS